MPIVQKVEPAAGVIAPDTGYISIFSNSSNSDIPSYKDSSNVTHTLIGAQGAQGANGAQGAAGTQGTQGAQGATGAQGSTGAGTQGAQGAAGTQGTQGPQGANGAQGATGSGTQGATGSQGPQGATGAQGGGGGAGTFVQLAQVVTTSSATTVTFSSISASYTTLKLIWSGSASNASDVQGLFLQVNGDSTSGNYTNAFVRNSGGGADTTTANGTVIGAISGRSSDASGISGGEITIPDYASTSFFKTIICTNYCKYSSGIAGLQCGRWASNSAINALVLTVVTGTFVDGFKATLYGIN